LKKLSKKKKSQDYEVQGQVPSCILGEVLAAGLGLLQIRAPFAENNCPALLQLAQLGDD